jgi:hypothetical protein
MCIQRFRQSSLCIYFAKKSSEHFWFRPIHYNFPLTKKQLGAGDNFGYDCRDKLQACYATPTSGIIHNQKFETPSLEKDWNESPRAWAETTDLFPSQILKLASPLIKRMRSVVKLKLKLLIQTRRGPLKLKTDGCGVVYYSRCQYRRRESENCRFGHFLIPATDLPISRWVLHGSR